METHDVAKPVARTLRRSLIDPAEIWAFFGDGAEYLPSKHGSYRLDVEMVGTPTISVEWLSHHGEVIVDEHMPGRQAFAIFGDGVGDLRVDGDSARPNLVAAASTERHLARVRGPSSYALVIVSGAWADTHGRALWHVDAGPEQQTRLTTLVARLRELGRRDGVSPASLAAGCESVADALHCVLDGVDSGRPPDPDLANQLVTDAIAAIREGRAASVTELVNEVAASRSSLYRSFDSVLGISPFAYLNRRRLISLRRRLLEAENEPGIVTREAANVGAFHLGNLAKSYRAMFGELPHDTATHSLTRVPGNDPAITADLT